MRTVSIRELANETTAVIQETVRTEQPALITNRGKPVALLIPVGSAIVEDAILAHAQEYVSAMVEADRDLVEGHTTSLPGRIDDLLTPDQRQELPDDLARMATVRRRAEAESRSLFIKDPRP